jgi:phage protein D
MTIEVSFPLSGDIAFTTSVSIIEAEYQHSVVSLDLPGSQAGQDFVHGTPVHIHFSGYRGDPAEWYGYVDTVRQSTNRTHQSQSSAVCVGMTYPLKEQRQDVWSNATGDGVAEAMAARWRLGVDLEPSDRVWPSLAQAGMSDWALLVTLAHDLGYTLYSRGPLLCFYTRARDLSAYGDVAPIFEYTAQQTNTDIIEFEPQSSASQIANNQNQLTTVDSTGAVVQFANADGTGSILGSIDTLPNFTSVNMTTATDAQEASQILLAQIEDNRFHIRAKARLRGDTRLRPALPIYLAGLPAQWNGQWFVLQVTHQLAPRTNQSTGLDTYYCDVLIGRDGMGPSTAIPAQGDVNFSDGVTAEIGPTGLWQCGPFVQTPEEAPPPDFVLERLAARGL